MQRLRNCVGISFSLLMLAGLVPPCMSGSPQVSGSTAYAPRGEAQRTPAQAVDILDARLSLSSDQKAAVLSLIQTLQTELSTLKDSGASPRVASDERHAFISTTAGQVRDLLNQSQQARFDAIRSEQLAQIFGR